MAEQNFPDNAIYEFDNLDMLRSMNSETVELFATDPPRQGHQQEVDAMKSLDVILSPTPPPYLEKARARPFVKWAGGKRSLVPDIAQLLPDNIGIYWEPFVGGGAVFFALDSSIGTARLSDVNAELALTYQIIRQRPEKLIEKLACHAEQHALDDHYYYRVRKLTHSSDSVEVAARFIYLNKTCYNGLYRVNKQGLFNVPKGNYKSPMICDADGLRKANQVLQKASVKFMDFGRVEPREQDFIYCDPPYDGTFANYTPDGFAEKHQRRLRDAVIKWHRVGARVMVSNADTPLIRSLYTVDQFEIHEVTALRNINCKGGDRGSTPELLITTYAT